MPRTPKNIVTVTGETRNPLTAIVQSRSIPHGLTRRAQIVLMFADGIPAAEIAQRLGLSRPTVQKWRDRFVGQGLMGLYEELRPGAPRKFDDEQIALLVRQTLDSKPEGSTPWSCRSLARDTGISKSTVQRILAAFRIQPHRQKHFKLSTDPFFVEKVRDIVGLYLDPPDKALVLCVDEKRQIQALERTQPVLPRGMGYVEGVTHDYVRHGTTTLFAALDIASGKVITQCKPRHRHQEFLAFLKHLDKNVPPDLDLHLIVDNYGTHKHPKVKQWLATRPRYHMHYTPTYASWIHQVEIWFNLITQQAIRRGSFRKVKELVVNIKRFVKAYNPKAKPFVWTATADSIRNKIDRPCKYPDPALRHL